ncbi:helix-turn-helix domain-containing protein [Pseudooceanicola spongiae]|uniref:helix-turn-helix domain-containing protein n=1 Tax=Pseudooceanicola spongiae TaxID=2613965 RepID=UPI001867FEFA|nr:helix-turn-helix domain-containing protein [Pseudooceanicola spongiae]
MAGFGSVRSLERGLQVLQVVNQRNGLKAAEVAAETGIPRPTVYRLLETLEGLGFVGRDHSSDKWRPTLQTKSLSSGFRDEDWVSQSAVPEMVRLGREILWPLDLVIFNDHRMEIRESTHNISPYSIDHGMVGLMLPVLETAGGRAYLAFSQEEESAQTIRGLLAKERQTHPVMLSDGPLEYVLEQSRKLGVGFRREGYRLATQSISAPIFRDTRVIACLTIIWTGSALSFDSAVERYRDKLVATARRISLALEQV